MRKTEDNMTVAEFLTQKIAESGKTQRVIAEECGFENPNIITMFKKGDTRLPLNRIEALAFALNIDPAQLLRLVMLEYMPRTWNSIEWTMKGSVMSQSELRLVSVYRQLRAMTDMAQIEFEARAVAGMMLKIEQFDQAKDLPAAPL
jgi:transcriptional regulator with XRE-family HTH domain